MTAMTEPRRSPLQHGMHKYLSRLPGDIFKILVMLLFLFPFYWMFFTSFKTYQESIIKYNNLRPVWCKNGSKALPK